MSNSTAQQILRDTFGYASFRGAQQAIVEHVATQAAMPWC
jgi:superfamily II DNA helicase RecQ